MLGMMLCGMSYKWIHQTTITSATAIKHYTGIAIPQDEYDKLIDIDNFIVKEEQSGKQVFFLNYTAAFYLIPLDKFSYKYDTMFIGNFGTQGEKEVIQQMYGKNNIVVIIGGQGMEPNRQETNFFQEYVRANMNGIGALHGFDVYSK
ncbi:MAG: hypothetical protein ABRQ23_03340 [Syntrophomonadaceae bacterium]